MAFSPANSGLQPEFNDKFLHVCGFFIMAILAHLAHPLANRWVLICGLTLFGFMIELVQAYLPYRTFSLWDWAADIVGLMLYFQFFASLLSRLVFQRVEE